MGVEIIIPGGATGNGLKMLGDLPIDAIPNFVIDSNGNQSNLKLSTDNSIFEGIAPQIQLKGQTFTDDENLSNGTGGVIAGYSFLSGGFFKYASGTLQMKPDTGESFFTGTDVGIGTTTPQAILDLVSTNKGFLMPRMTEAQILALTPYAGLQAYNTDINEICFYDGSGWRKISHSNM
jgi:hypothetical protein